MGNDIVNNKKSYTMHSSFYFKWWGRWDLNPHGINSQRILSPLRLPISPRPHKKLEVPTGFEPVDTGVADHCLTTWLRNRFFF